MTDASPASSPPQTAAAADFLPERISLLYRFALEDIVPLAVATGVTAFALWGYVEARLLGSWLVWMVLAFTVRVILHRIHSRLNPPPEAAHVWEAWYLAVAAALGTAWGVCILFVFPGKGDLYQILVSSMICTLALGMPSALAPSPKTFTALLVPILAPLIALLFTDGGFETSAAILLLEFTGVMLVLYLGAHRSLMETLRFEQENVELAEQLHASDRSLAAASTELKVIFDSAAVGLALIKDDRIARCNEAFAEFFGYPRGELTGQSTRIMYPSDTAWNDRRAAAYKCFAEGHASVADLELARKDGETFWGSIEARGLDLRNPSAGIILALRDITPRKRAEQELLASLQREKELNEMKTDFVSVVSHEFRTPLSTIMSSAELMRLYPDKIDDKLKLNLLTGTEDATKRMRRLLDEVLTLGRAESGVLLLRPTEIPLSELCGNIVHEFRIGEGRQHTIVFDDRFDRATAQLDENLLRHILNNLLANAFKYSAPGTTVRLTLERADGNIRFTVEDSGIGIPAEDQPRLFESFYRASNAQNRKGSGLGLAIVKKSVDLHGGSIAFDTKVGAGTRFYVTLPLQSPAPAAAA